MSAPAPSDTPAPVAPAPGQAPPIHLEPQPSTLLITRKPKAAPKGKAPRPTPSAEQISAASGSGVAPASALGGALGRMASSGCGSGAGAGGGKVGTRSRTRKGVAAVKGLDDATTEAAGSMAAMTGSEAARTTTSSSEAPLPATNATLADAQPTLPTAEHPAEMQKQATAEQQDAPSPDPATISGSAEHQKTSANVPPVELAASEASDSAARSASQVIEDGNQAEAVNEVDGQMQVDETNDEELESASPEVSDEGQQGLDPVRPSTIRRSVRSREDLRNDKEHRSRDASRHRHMHKKSEKGHASGRVHRTAKHRRSRTRSPSYSVSSSDGSGSLLPTDDLSASSSDEEASDRRPRSRERSFGSRKRAHPGGSIPRSHRRASPRGERSRRDSRRPSKRVKRESHSRSGQRSGQHDSAHQFSDAESETDEDDWDEQLEEEIRRLKRRLREKAKSKARRVREISSDGADGGEVHVESSSGSDLGVFAFQAVAPATQTIQPPRTIAQLPHRARTELVVKVNPDWIEQRDPPLVLKDGVRASLVWNDWLHTLPQDMQPIVRWEWVGESGDDGGWRKPGARPDRAEGIGGIEYWEQTPAENVSSTYRARLVLALPPTHPKMMARLLSANITSEVPDYEVQVAQHDGLRIYEAATPSHSPGEAMNDTVAVALRLNVLTWLTGGRIVNAQNYDTKKDLQTGSLLASQSTVSQGLLAAPFASYKAGQLDFLPGVDKAPPPETKEKRREKKLAYDRAVRPVKDMNETLKKVEKVFKEKLLVMPAVRESRLQANAQAPERLIAAPPTSQSLVPTTNALSQVYTAVPSSQITQNILATDGFDWFGHLAGLCARDGIPNPRFVREEDKVKIVFGPKHMRQKLDADMSDSDGFCKLTKAIVTNWSKLSGQLR